MQDAIVLSVKKLHVPVHSSAGTQKASQLWDGITGLFETIKKICGLAERLNFQRYVYYFKSLLKLVSMSALTTAHSFDYILVILHTRVSLLYVCA